MIMVRPVSRFLLALVIGANAGAALLFSGAGAVVSSVGSITSSSWNPVLRWVGDYLTLPIPTGDITDLRDVVLPVMLGLALLTLGVGIFLRSPSALSTDRETGVRNPAERWLWITTGGVMIISIMSGVVNSSFELSWGWIVRFAAGAGWALLLARLFTRDMTRMSIIGLLVIALFCLLLTIAHRADRQFAYFSWPIGPVTLTAAMASLWAALAAGSVAVIVFYQRRFNRGAILSLVTCLICVYVLQQAGRRAPALGFVTAVLLISTILIGPEFRTRRVKLMLRGIMVATFVAAASYVIIQARSKDRTTSGPIALRLAYWTVAGGLIWDRPSLGFGPDTFIVEMTNAVAPRRAESPHFYHGNITFYAHNEWIQAAVELGIPGGLFYLAVPLGPMFMAWRRLRAPPQRAEANGNGRQATVSDWRERAMIVALLAGLTAVVITEAASITLRDAIMPVPYWTLVGLLASCCRETVPQDHSKNAKREILKLRIEKIPAFVCTIVLTAVSIFFLGVSYLDLSNACKQTKVAEYKGEAAVRLYSKKTIAVRERVAHRASALARLQTEGSRIQEAVTRWRQLYYLIPGYWDVPARYAEALLLANQKKQARSVLDDALSPRLNAYEPAANALYAKHFTDDPVEKLRCIQRALRHSALTAELSETLAEIAADTAVNEIMQNELSSARKLASSRRAPTAADGTVELLRINAFLKFDAGQHAQALADQRLAAGYYEFLERTNDLYRRGHDAETDTFFHLAKMLYETDPANYLEAYDAIMAAERYAILGVSHHRLRAPKPEYGFLLGEVVPNAIPRRWQSLWQLSALLKVVTGHDQFLDYRILFGHTLQDWSQSVLNRELTRLARRAYEDLSRIPAEKRPKHYGLLPDMARRYSSDTR